MVNVLYYLAGPGSKEELEEVSFAFNLRGHNICYAGRGMELESITDAVFCTSPKAIGVVDKERNITRPYFAHDFLIYDTRNSEDSEEIVEDDLVDLVNLSEDFPVLLINESPFSGKVENTLNDSYIHSIYGNPSISEILDLVERLKLKK